jgi:hypothetical protein
MTNEFLKTISVLIGALVFIVYVNPLMYSLLNPVTFWQNFVMLFTVDVLAFIFTVGGIAGFLNKVFE